MLIHHRPRVSAGRIAFEFERLPVAVGHCSGTMTGTAHIAYDGHGAWWIDQIEVSNPRQVGPDIFLPVSDPLFAEVRERLDQYRGEDIAERIEQALAAGQHQRLFDEHRPHVQDRRGAPPHARRLSSDTAGQRLASVTRGTARGTGILSIVLQVAGAGVELSCLALFVGGLWGLGYGLSPDHGFQAHASRHVARLEMPEDRP